MKKVLSLLLTVVMLVSVLASCSGSSLKEDEKGAIINMGVATLPGAFDPSAYALDADLAKVYGLIYSTLTVLNDEGELEGSIAEEWGYFYDDIYLEHKMYFDMKESGWSDGRALSADDFVYAWKRILSPASQSPYAAMLYCIKNAKSVKFGDMTSDDLGLYAVDDTRIEITFEDEYIKDNGEDAAEQFAEVVANVAFAPLREDKVDGNASFSTSVNVSDILSCGPFFLRSYSVGSEDTDRYMEFERNKYFMRNDEEKEALDISVVPYKIVCTLNDSVDANGEKIGQIDRLANEFKAGNIYYIGEFTPNSYGSVETESMDNLSAYAYYFNLDNKLFAKADVRKALSMAIDRNEVARIVGCGSTAAGGFVPNGVFNTVTDTSFRTSGGNVYNAGADVNGAKSLLQSAGVTSGSFTITYIGEVESNVNQLVAEYVASVWNGLGFNVNVKALDQNNVSYIRDLIYGVGAGERNPFDVLAVDMTMNSSNALAYLAPFASGYSGSYVDITADEISVDTHFTGYNSEEYNELIAKAVASSDRDERANLLHQAEAILANDCPAIALVNYKNSYAVADELDGYEHLYNGAPVFNEAELEDWRDVNAKIEAEEEAKNAPAETSK
ncbi:MAG: hypothetical protein IJN86_02115 [Clostridia bacterium]|nr:hypothetical protein [Clostridia bacterium]